VRYAIVPGGDDGVATGAAAYGVTLATADEHDVVAPSSVELVRTLSASEPFRAASADDRPPATSGALAAGADYTDGDGSRGDVVSAGRAQFEAALRGSDNCRSSACIGDDPADLGASCGFDPSHTVVSKNRDLDRLAGACPGRRFDLKGSACVAPGLGVDVEPQHPIARAKRNL
jgi:hypothetical protein